MERILNITKHVIEIYDKIDNALRYTNTKSDMIERLIQSEFRGPIGQSSTESVVPSITWSAEKCVKVSQVDSNGVDSSKGSDNKCCKQECTDNVESHAESSYSNSELGEPDDASLSDHPQPSVDEDLNSDNPLSSSRLDGIDDTDSFLTENLSSASEEEESDTDSIEPSQWTDASEGELQEEKENEKVEEKVDEKEDKEEELSNHSNKQRIGKQTIEYTLKQTVSNPSILLRKKTGEPCSPNVKQIKSSPCMVETSWNNLHKQAVDSVVDKKKNVDDVIIKESTETDVKIENKMEGNLKKKMLEKIEDDSIVDELQTGSRRKHKLTSVESQINYRDTNEKFLFNKRRQQRSSIFQFGNDANDCDEIPTAKNLRFAADEVMAGDSKANTITRREPEVIPRQSPGIVECHNNECCEEYPLEIKITKNRSGDSDYLSSMMQAKRTKLKVLGSSIYM